MSRLQKRIIASLALAVTAVCFDMMSYLEGKQHGRQELLNSEDGPGELPSLRAEDKPCPCEEEDSPVAPDADTPKDKASPEEVQD